jgi:hypothetical protein
VFGCTFKPTAAPKKATPRTGAVAWRMHSGHLVGDIMIDGFVKILNVIYYVRHKHAPSQPEGYDCVLSPQSTISVPPSPERRRAEERAHKDIRAMAATLDTPDMILILRALCTTLPTRQKSTSR